MSPEQFTGDTKSGWTLSSSDPCFDLWKPKTGQNIKRPVAINNIPKVSNGNIKLRPEDLKSGKQSDLINRPMAIDTRPKDVAGSFKAAKPAQSKRRLLSGDSGIDPGDVNLDTFMTFDVEDRNTGDPCSFCFDSLRLPPGCDLRGRVGAYLCKVQPRHLPFQVQVLQKVGRTT